MADTKNGNGNGDEKTTTKKRKKRKGKPTISSKGYGPDVGSNDRFALSSATSIEIFRQSADVGKIKASLVEGKTEESPWSGSAELWRDIEVGWKGEAGKFVDETNRSSIVLQSVWKQIGECDKLSFGVQNGLMIARILKKSHKSELAFILGRVNQGKTKK